MSQRRDDFCSYSERSAMAVRLELPRKMAPNPIDQYVGSRVRMRRKMLGMSQEKLGGALGLTFQQVQKYKRGANRIGASRLQQMSHILQVSIEFFFEGAPNASAPHGSNGSTLSMADAPTRSRYDMTRTARALVLCCYGLIGAAWLLPSSEPRPAARMEATAMAAPTSIT